MIHPVCTQGPQRFHPRGKYPRVALLDKVLNLDSGRPAPRRSLVYLRMLPDPPERLRIATRSIRIERSAHMGVGVS